MPLASIGPRALRRVATLGLLLGAFLAAEAATATTAPHEAQPAQAPRPAEGQPTEAQPVGACIAFGDPCNDGDSCCGGDAGWGVCHAFGRGRRCTIACPADPSDCPNAGRGCNNQSPSMCRSGKGGGGGKDKNKNNKP